MPSVIVYRSQSASFAAKRVASASEGHIRAVQQDGYRHLAGDSAVIRWDCYDDLPIPSGVRDINPAAAVRAAREKGAARVTLAELAPPTWFNRADVQIPCVVRPRRHKAGNKFFVCRTHQDVAVAARRCGAGWYASRLINKSREFRVFVVGGRVAAVSERSAGDSHEVAWNLALGGRLRNLNRPEWPVDVLKAAITAMGRVGLGFGAVDACIDTDGRIWVFELNTSPALKNKFTISQLAKALSSPFVDAPIKEGAKRPKSYAHPGVLQSDASPAVPEQPTPALPVVPVVSTVPTAPVAAAAASTSTPAITPPAPRAAVREETPMPFNIPATFNASAAQAAGLTTLNILNAPTGRTIGWIIDKAHEVGASHFLFDGIIYDARTIQPVYRRAA